MPGTNVLREFLVSIRYQQNAASLRALRSTLGHVAGQLGRFTGIGGLSLGGVAAAVGLTANRFAELYYQAQRVGTTPGQLMRFAFAAKQIGLSGEGFLAMAEGLAKTLRQNPALRIFARSLGVVARDAPTMLRQLAEYYARMMKLGPVQEMIARNLIGTLGVNVEMVRQMAKNLPELVKSLSTVPDLYRAIGFSAERAAEAGLEYERTTNELWLQISATFDKIILTLVPAFKAAVIALSTIFREHEGDIKNFVQNVLIPNIEWLKDPKNWADIIRNVDDVADAFRAFAVVINGIAAAVKGLADGVRFIREMFGYVKAEKDLGEIAPNPKVVERLKRQGKLPGGYEAPGARSWIYEQMGGIGTAWGSLKKWVTGQTMSPYVEIHEAEGLWDRLKQWLHGSSGFEPWVRVREPSDKQLREAVRDTHRVIARLPPAPGAPPVPPGTGRGGVSMIPPEGITPPAGLRPGGKVSAAPGADASLAEGIRFFVGKGLSVAQATGVVARLAQESGGDRLNPNAINRSSGAYGIAQWLGSRKPAALASHGDLGKQLELVWHEFQTSEKDAFRRVLGQNTAYGAAMAMESFERAGNQAFTVGAANFARRISGAFAVAGPPNAQVGGYGVGSRFATPAPAGVAPLAAAGGTNVSLSPTTNIHVYGGGPEVGSYVFGTQRRLNADLVRNLSTLIL